MVNTTGFLNTIRDAVKTETVSESSHLAVGDDDTAASANDTALGAEHTRKARQEYSTGTNDVIMSLFLGAVDANGENLKEVGVFDAAAAGNMMMRATFTTIAKSATVDVWIDVEEQISVTQ